MLQLPLPLPSLDPPTYRKQKHIPQHTQQITDKVINHG